MGNYLLGGARAILMLALATVLLAMVWGAPEAASQDDDLQTTGSPAESPGSDGGSVLAIPGFYPIDSSYSPAASGLDGVRARHRS